MPLGLCTACHRAYIFDSNPQTAIDSCPYCGDALRAASVQETRDLPEPPPAPAHYGLRVYRRSQAVAPPAGTLHVGPLPSIWKAAA